MNAPEWRMIEITPQLWGGSRVPQTLREYHRIVDELSEAHELMDPSRERDELADRIVILRAFGATAQSLRERARWAIVPGRPLRDGQVLHLTVQTFPAQWRSEARWTGVVHVRQSRFGQLTVSGQWSPDEDPQPQAVYVPRYWPTERLVMQFGGETVGRMLADGFSKSYLDTRAAALLPESRVKPELAISSAPPEPAEKWLQRAWDRTESSDHSAWDRAREE